MAAAVDVIIPFRFMEQPITSHSAGGGWDTEILAVEVERSGSSYQRCSGILCSFELMKVRLRNLFAVVFAIPILVAGVFVYREYDERRMIREEEVLKRLDMGSFSVQDATLETAVKLIVERIHARGHPEVRLRPFSDAKQAPYFHRELNRLPSTLDLSPSSTMTFTLSGPLTLNELLRYVGGLSGSTCDFHGRDLVVVPAIGTMERFGRHVFRAAPFAQMDEKSALQWLKANGVEPRYEGMTIELTPEKSVVFFGPSSENPFDHEAVHFTLEERLRTFVLEWWARLGY